MKRLVLAVFTVAIVAAAMGAGTMAYFSASAVNSNNSFTAGTMRFDITSPTSNGSAVFNVTGMKPGQTATGYIVVANGSPDGMNEKWRAWISGGGELESALKAKITLRPSESSAPAVPANFVSAGPVNGQVITDFVPIANIAAGNNIMLWASNAGPFQPNWAAVYKIEVQMDPNAGNEYQGKSFTGAINFEATQYENTTVGY